MQGFFVGGGEGWHVERKRFLCWVSSENKEKKHVAVFASGAGSNARKFLEYFSSSEEFDIQLIVTNNPNAGVLNIAKEYGVESLLISKEVFSSEGFLKQLEQKKIAAVVLAGFLWKIPEYLIAAYPERIINIHPALLPGYGGKGMYGSNVHSAIIAGQERRSGITIHLVDELYDNGKILFQATVGIAPDDNSEKLAAKIHKLEHAHFPVVVDSYLYMVLKGESQ
jgi:phosphoribosylglycinamide formyltransferase 1